MRAANSPVWPGCFWRADSHEGHGQKAGVVVAGGGLVPVPIDQRACVGEKEPLTQASGCDLGGQPRGRGTALAPGWG